MTTTDHVNIIVYQHYEHKGEGVSNCRYPHANTMYDIHVIISVIFCKPNSYFDVLEITVGLLEIIT